MGPMIQRTNISISHSHLDSELECQLKGLIAYRLGYRSPLRGTTNRRGILGHEIVAAVLRGNLDRVNLECSSPEQWQALSPIVDKQHERNKWEGINDTYDDAEHACYGAARILDAMEWAEFTSIEEKHIAPLDDLLRMHGITGKDADILRAHCINGQAKTDAIAKTSAGLEIADWKMKQSPIPDYATDVLRVPDTQACWYWAVLRCIGIDITGVAQVLVHCEKPAPLLSAKDVPINKDGKPSRSCKNILADEYVKAIRSSRDLHPEKFTPATIALYQTHLATLDALAIKRASEEGIKVTILPRRIDQATAIKINRDRLLNLARNLKNVADIRSLKVYTGSPCTKPPFFKRGDNEKGWPCMVQEACHLSLRAQLKDALHTLSTQGEHRYTDVYKKKEEKT